MGEPTVSVIIPAYNAAKFVGVAIRSVLAQTFTDHELIVVDDGSTDATVAVANTFGDRVRLLRQRNGGAAAARNRGMRAARGEWLAFLDSDDEWRPNHLAALLARSESEPEAHLVYGTKVTVDESGEVVNHADPPRFPAGWIFADLVESCLIQLSTILVRADTMRELGGFDEHVRFWVTQDWDLLLRLAARYPVALARDTCVTYRRLGTSLCHQVLRTQAGNIAALETAARLLADGLVAPENHPERIDMTARWRSAYTEAVVHMFTVGEYRGARRIGAEALRRGHWTVPVVSRTLVACLPAAIVTRIRDLSRRSPTGTKEAVR